MSNGPRRPDSSPPQAAEENQKQEPEIVPAQPAESTQQKQRTAIIAQMEQWSGPLPPPAVLEQFNRIIPGGADRIVKLAENEQAHRIAYEREGLEATRNEARRGQYLGAAISGAAIIGAVVTAMAGASAAVPLAFLSVPVLGIVRALVRPRGDDKD